MKVLIVGGGGREHALAWKISKSPKVDKIYCAPGNAGIAEYAETVPIQAMEFDKLIEFAKSHEIDLTVIGMDDPLAGGIVDAFNAEGLRVFGPAKNAAILEGSKAFSKDLMKKYNIPTAAYETFDDPEKALLYLKTAKMPIVLKADGLALGKGVLICNTLYEAQKGVKAIMQDKQFGAAGNRIVVEEFMTGREVSVLSFVDGDTIKIMTSAQDHKRAGDGDTGLNTGGMGTFSPSPFYTKEVDKFCRKNIYQKTVDAMKAEGRTFKGIIFFGLMLTKDGPKVLEYNARFGDPETQVVLPRMKNDIIDVFEACIDGTLDKIELKFENNAAVCVVLASDGYPEHYEKGFKITGLENFKNKDGYYAFHAGTGFDENGSIVTNGGRVLGITATGKDLKTARANAYKATEWVDFDNKYMRTDIGKAIDENAAEPPPQRTTLGQDILSLMIKIVVILLIFAALFTWIFGIYRNSNIYMTPAVKDGDLIVYYRLDKMYAASDMAVVEYDGKLQSERVVAIAGDSVDITEAGLMINGALQQNLDIYTSTYRFDGGIEFPLVVGEGQIFLLGDNRPDATDSRVYGCVNIKDTKGKVIGIIRRRNL